MADDSGHGGARDGSGRKPKPVNKIDIEETDDPMEFMLAVMNNPEADAAVRLRAAAAAAKLRQERAGGTGRKGEQKRAADAAGQGRFAPTQPPKLVVNNRR